MSTRTALEWVSLLSAAVLVGVLAHAVTSHAATNPGIVPYVQTYQQATSTFAWGINLSGGCFAVAGVCIGIDTSFSTTSADHWLTTKSTTNLTEGSNLYYTLARWAAALAGTTTDALAEGSTRLYYTDARAGAYISGSSTVPHIGGSAAGDILRWTGSAWGTMATSGINYQWGALGGIPAGFADGVDDTGSSLSGGSAGVLTAWTDATTLTATSSPTVGHISATGTATSTFAHTINLLGGCFAFNGTCVNGAEYILDTIMSAFTTGNSVGYDFTYDDANNEVDGTFDCSDVEGPGINCTGEAITLDATGDWTGTLDGLNGPDLLTLAAWYATTSAPQLTTLANLSITASQVSDFNAAANAYIHGSTTIPKTYTANTYTGLQTFATARATAVGIGKAASASIRLDILTDGTYTQGARVEGDANTRLGFSGFVTGDAQVRYTQRVDGFMGWGDGTNVTDTSLYRSAANTLKTDDAFIVQENLTVSSTTASSSLQWVTATAFGIAGKFFADASQFWVNLATRFLAAVTFNGAVTFFGDMAVGTSTDPAISLTNNFEINTTAASSSIRYFDGTAERALYPDFQKTLKISTSTILALNGNPAATTTVKLDRTILHPLTHTARYCETTTGTWGYIIGNGTASSSYVHCSTTGATQTSLTNATFTLNSDIYIEIGPPSTNATVGTLIVGGRYDAD